MEDKDEIRQWLILSLVSEKNKNKKLTVHNKLLALLFAHSPAKLRVNKPVHVKAARASNCKWLPCQETVEGGKHLGEVKGHRTREETLMLHLSQWSFLSSAVSYSSFTHLSSVFSVPAGHDQMRRQLLLVLVGDVPHQSGSWANPGLVTYLNTDRSRRHSGWWPDYCSFTLHRGHGDLWPLKSHHLMCDSE